MKLINGLLLLQLIFVLFLCRSDLVYGQNIDASKKRLEVYTILSSLQKYVRYNNVQLKKVSPKNEILSLKLQLLNAIAKDFIVFVEAKASEKKYQDAIKIHLNGIGSSRLLLDSEDEDDVCTRIEGLMDIVGLESSGGHLNKWRYGFDPNAIKKPN